MNSKESGHDNSTLTIFTIPETFFHIETGKHQSITPEMHDFFQKHVKQHKIIDAFMTAVFHYAHGSSQSENFDRLEGKMEEVLRLLNEKQLNFGTVEQTSNSHVELPEQLDELLSEFGG